jgi:hypothetical protein
LLFGVFIFLDIHIYVYFSAKFCHWFPEFKEQYCSTLCSWTVLMIGMLFWGWLAYINAFFECICCDVGCENAWFADIGVLNIVPLDSPCI